ncbi:hypothetical protein CLV45_2465 [Hymenobacter chitinivorans DSM 11115]|uniref:Uncharacterized protein n=2 Tax=Hymenobacter chitinivorans TaxID=89969 RepID=A0A2M9BSU8_9BACT|nr:hypothetical protein CLV45_2465 [Hymenobacter chitinivorans DSM 11115]
MEDILQPLLVILVGGLFAPLLTQIVEKLYAQISGNTTPEKPLPDDDTSLKRKKWLRFFATAVAIQLLLFTGFFFLSKATYFDKNYFPTTERELIREGLKKNKQYVIPRIVFKIYSESRNGVALINNIYKGKGINYCTLVSIDYEIIALKDFNSEKLFEEYYNAIDAIDVLQEPGSEIEGKDANPQPAILTYQLTSTLKKYERRTITTRADFIYNTLPAQRTFFNKIIAGTNTDIFYYPNNEDDVIGELEFQIISRSLDLNTPAKNDVILSTDDGKEITLDPVLVESRDNGCLNFKIITAKVPRLLNNSKVGIKWSWR